MNDYYLIYYLPERGLLNMHQLLLLDTLPFFVAVSFSSRKIHLGFINSMTLHKYMYARSL